MDNFEEQMLSEWEIIEQFISDNQLGWEYGTNICHPLDNERPLDLLANSFLHPLPSPATTTEVFAGSAGHLPYGSLHTSNATGAEDISMVAYPGTYQSQWSSMSSSLHHGALRASVPQFQNQYQPLICGWSRDLESYPVSLPSNSQPLSTTLSPSTYANGCQHHDDPCIRHVLGGNVDTCASPPDDTALSFSGFLRALADYNVDPQSHSNGMSSVQSTVLSDSGFLSDSGSLRALADYDADPQPSLIHSNSMSCVQPTGLSTSGFLRALADYDADSQPSPTHNNGMSSAQSTALSRSEPTCEPDRQTRIFACQWLNHGVSCDVLVMADRRSVIEHLQLMHGMKPGEEKFRQTCLWEGCTKVLNKESLARHILTVHLKEKVHCVECGLFFAREDSLKRHLKGAQHELSSGKSAARQQSRNPAGF